MYNIAQTDFNLDPVNSWPSCTQEITTRLSDQNPAVRLVGLKALKELVRAFYHEVEPKNRVLRKIAQDFLPLLGSIMKSTFEDQSGNEYQLKTMIIVAKIFFMVNYMKIDPSLIETDNIDAWINIFVSILESAQEPTSFLVQPTDDMAQIEMLDNHEWWKLKAICSKIAVKIYQK